MSPAGGISDTTLTVFSRFIAGHMGLCFPENRWRDLVRGVSSAMKDLDFHDLQDCIDWLMSSNPTHEQLDILASHLTVGETYFFREKKIFDSLEQLILPDLVHARAGTDRRIRIWSAGCSTGEEPYSVAILLRRMLPDLTGWNIAIVATDINRRFLLKAERGSYSDWSFRSTPAWVKERYFRQAVKNRNEYEILPSIRSMVTFQYLNLAQYPYPLFAVAAGAFDIIICSNVLMYFTREYVERVLQNLCLSLSEGGWLIVSPVEAAFVDLDMKKRECRLETTALNGMSVFRKTGSTSKKP